MAWQFSATRLMQDLEPLCLAWVWECLQSLCVTGTQVCAARSGHINCPSPWPCPTLQQRLGVGGAKRK